MSLFVFSLFNNTDELDNRRASSWWTVRDFTASGVNPLTLIIVSPLSVSNPYTLGAMNAALLITCSSLNFPSSLPVKEKVLPAKPFKLVKSDTELTPNNVFMTIDIETVLIDNIQTPYLICGYGKDIQIESRADSHSVESQDKMFKEFITKLIAVKKKNKHLKYVYAHNFGGFDGILFIKHLINYEGSTVKPLIFNNKLMSVRFDFKCEGHKNKSTLLFKDSYLMLPYALRALCTSFNVNNPKTYFPYLLTILNYIGEYPEVKYFTKISKEIYNSNKDSFRGLWSFREESLKYCRNDCIALFEVLEKFNALIFDNFKKNVHSTLTLSALAMNIYKSLYMPNDTLFQMLGTVEKDIREAYTGGRVDVFKAHNSITPQPTDKNIELYYYDVNALYPFIMSTLDMPTGKPIAFTGNILKYEPDAKGFFYCDIEASEQLLCPTLQRRIKTKDGVRTIAGTGTWKGWIHYDEYHTCVNRGYNIKIIKGYKFKYTNIFKDYVETLYNLRQQYTKDNPMNLIAKMLMNSLYGKFGMKSENNKVEIFDTNDTEDMDRLNTILDCDGESIQDQIEIGRHLLIVRKKISACKYDAKEDVYHGLDVNVKTKRDMYAGKIGVLNSSYNLMVSSSKRAPISIDVARLKSDDPVSRLFYLYNK